MPVLQSDIDSVLAHVIPHIEQHRASSDGKSAPFILGLSGVQGSGKSSWAQGLADTLRAKYQLKVVILSLDDLYYPHDKMLQVKQAHPDNELFRNRGQPGTHDEALAARFFSSLLAGQDVALPAYDKSCFSGEGDRVPESEWEVVSASQPVDVLIFEGWCLGFEAIDDEALAHEWETARQDPINSESLTNELRNHPLEHIQLINSNLSRYNQAFMGRALFEYFVHLDTSSLQNVYRWRIQQEQALRATRHAGLTDDQVVSFVKVYMPAYELYLDGLRRRGFGKVYLRVVLDENRRVVGMDEA